MAVGGASIKGEQEHTMSATNCGDRDRLWQYMWFWSYVAVSLSCAPPVYTAHTQAALVRRTVGCLGVPLSQA
jgi:hypothetical protein